MSRKALATIVTRHQVLLERLKTRTARDFTAVLPELDRAIRDVLFALGADDLRGLSARKLQGLLTELRTAQEGLITEAAATLKKDLSALAGYESQFEHRTLKAVLDAGGQAALREYMLRPTKAAEAYKRALERPLSATGELLETFVDGWGRRQVAGVERTVRRAWGEGQTIQQVITTIRGTRAGRYKDGLLEVSRRQAEAVARTSVQHVAQAAREAAWEENDDLVVGVIFVATLDSATTQQCRSLDGREFPLREGPRPPLHINCRSTTIPRLPREFDFLDKGATRSSVDGYVPASKTYYDWLKGQPPAFQDEALGKARAELFRDGGLDAKEFARLNLGRDFQPLTLQQMATREPLAFEKAGLREYLKGGKG